MENIDYIKIMWWQKEENKDERPEGFKLRGNKRSHVMKDDQKKEFLSGMIDDGTIDKDI